MTILPALTSILAAVFAVMLLDQWRERRHGFQLVWAFGMLCYALGAGAEAVAAANGWNEGIYRAWYLTGAIWTAGWLGLGTAFLLGRTRFGYTYAVLLLFGALLTFVIRNSPNYAGAGALPFLYLFGGIILSLAIGVETYFVNPRWTWFAGGAMIVVTVLSFALVVLAPPLPAPGYSISAVTGQPTGEAMPGYIRLLTPLPNITGGGALLLGACSRPTCSCPRSGSWATPSTPASPASSSCSTCASPSSPSPSTSSPRCPAPCASCWRGASTRACRRRC